MVGVKACKIKEHTPSWKLQTNNEVQKGLEQGELAGRAKKVLCAEIKLCTALGHGDDFC